MNLSKNKFVQEVSISLIVLFLLLLLTDTVMIGMDSSIKMLLTATLSVAVFLFVLVFWRETAVQDERERYHSYIASKVAFLAGSISLVVVLILQYYSFSTSHWPAWVLGTMIFSKILAFQWSERRK